jgi:hypothetical protein
MSCVVLKRLVLDGCGLKSTLLEAGVDYNGFVTSPVAVARGVESDLEELEAEKAQEGSALSIADAENDAKIVKLLEALSSSDQEQIDEHERQEQLRERVDKLNQLRSQYCHSSIFTGLISLQELSLNENLFATYYSLGGLVLLEKLRSISLVENPLREKAHTSKYVDNVLFMSTLGPGFSFISGSGFSGSDAVTSTSTSKGSNITSTFSSSTISSSSLISIDGKRIHSASSLQSMHTNNQAIVLQHVNIHGITGIGNAASVDGMEREVQMELRGEKDITVVA